MSKKLQDAISASPLVRAAIVEAVHRFYYDRVLSPKKQDQEEIIEANAGQLIDQLWNLYPDWRNVLLTLPAQRYKGTDTKSVSIFGKPERTGFFFVSEINMIPNQ